jgi:uncharacterized protein (DUF1697 family)
MTTYIALLRAVNVGGTGKLPMTDLKAMCVAVSFSNVRTYIASGNVVFESMLQATQVKAALEAKLKVYAGQAVGVMVRTASQMAAVLANNPFPNAAPSKTVAIFLDAKPPVDAMQGITGRNAEEVALGLQEIYVHYAHGIGDSKLKIPAAKSGTARNMNTVAKLAEMAAQT